MTKRRGQPWTHDLWSEVYAGVETADGTRRAVNRGCDGGRQVTTAVAYIILCTAKNRRGGKQ